MVYNTEPTTGAEQIPPAITDPHRFQYNRSKNGHAYDGTWYARNSGSDQLTLTF